MASSVPMKRSASATEAAANKRPTHHYHHHHRLHEPVSFPPASEPVVQDDAHFEHLVNRAISQILRNVGFHVADPAALASLRSATEEFMVHISTFVRQYMLSSRRTQPLPQDFEHALKHTRISPGGLDKYITTPGSVSRTPTLPSSPPPEDEVKRKLPFLNALRDEEGQTNRSYVPKNFPDFPSKHTYSTTAVLTERDNDPRKIRERAAEDGRHGEEALRKLAGAAFRDNPTSSSGRDKKLWGQRMESMESMFQKTVKGLAKKLQKDARGPAAMDIDSLPTDGDKSKVSWNLEMGPIVNCERDYWRRTGGQSSDGKSSKPTPSAEPGESAAASG
ncbi:hypothetical protein N7492_006725 [Penicillium capsulatum]|uniref:Transcription initiation factor TFIID subunit 8 n=1 Tax=Penicillium capsulatum TaxID=69766 RepID=A0A9W9HYJ5_9EURO|nr:hypothetical protein N7492_006725 [Penicillium capsulatum]KAJ6116560.1 hypothetical protein N7512_006285 [Penicillium capsulatum]